MIRLNQQTERPAPPRHDVANGPPAISPPLHGMIDYATAALCLVLSRLPFIGSRTRRLLAMNGFGALLYSLFTDYELGAVRTLPYPTHLKLDAASGISLLTAPATLLRHEPLLGRCLVRTLGVVELLVTAASWIPAPTSRPQGISTDAAASAAEPTAPRS